MRVCLLLVGKISRKRVPTISEKGFVMINEPNIMNKNDILDYRFQVLILLVSVIPLISLVVFHDYISGDLVAFLQMSVLLMKLLSEVYGRRVRRSAFVIFTIFALLVFYW